VKKPNLTKKLILSKETLRMLADDDLRPRSRPATPHGRGGR